MPQAVYTSAKGIVQSAGTGLKITDGPVVLGSETVTDAGAAGPNVPLTLCVAGGTGGVVSVADGTVAGQIKHFVHTANGGGTQTITPATPTGAWASAAVSIVGQTVSIMWDGAGWVLIGRTSGANQAQNAVAGLAVIA